MTMFMRVMERAASWTGPGANVLACRLRAFTGSKSGAAAIFFALSAPVWLGGLALGAEVGSWYVIKQKLQSTADIVAAGVAARVGTGASAIELASLARAALALSQFDFSQGSYAVNASSSGPVFKDGSTVELTLTRTVKPYLTSIFRQAPFDIQAHAVARVTAATTGCVLALAKEYSDDGGLKQGTLAASGHIKIPGCEVLSNMQGNMFLEGTSEMTTDCARSYGSFVTRSAGALHVSCKNGPVEDAGFALDPYVGVPDLDLSQYPFLSAPEGTDFSWNSSVPLPQVAPVPNSTGVYSHFKGGSLTIDRPLVLSKSMLIILDGADLIINDDYNIYTTAVRFYFANGGKLIINAPSKAVKMANFASDPAVPGRGMLFMESRTNGLVTHRINVGPGSVIQGGIYFPSSTVEFQANGSLGGCLQIIGFGVRLDGAWESKGPCTHLGIKPIIASKKVDLTQ